MNKSLNQRGSHTWFIPLLIVLVSIIGFAGRYVYSVNKSVTNDSPDSSIQKPEGNLEDADQNAASDPNTEIRKTAETLLCYNATEYKDTMNNLTITCPEQDSIINTIELVVRDHGAGAGKNTYSFHGGADQTQYEVNFSPGCCAIGFEGEFGARVNYSTEVNNNGEIVLSNREYTPPDSDEYDDYFIYAGFYFNGSTDNEDYNMLTSFGDNADKWQEAVEVFEAAAKLIKFN